MQNPIDLILANNSASEVLDALLSGNEDALTEGKKLRALAKVAGTAGVALAGIKGVQAYGRAKSEEGAVSALKSQKKNRAPVPAPRSVQFANDLKQGGFTT